jgi:hypothetical protein
MLRFPKQKATVSNKGKRKTWDKKKLARHQRRKIAKISNSVLVASEQPQARQTELSPVSQFPALQAPSRRKFIKMAGMSAVAAALWRQAVAAGSGNASLSFHSCAGDTSYFSGWSQTYVSEVTSFSSIFRGTRENNYSEVGLFQGDSSREYVEGVDPEEPLNFALDAVEEEEKRIILNGLAKIQNDVIKRDCASDWLGNGSPSSKCGDFEHDYNIIDIAPIVDMPTVTIVQARVNYTATYIYVYVDATVQYKGKTIHAKKIMAGFSWNNINK